LVDNNQNFYKTYFDGFVDQFYIDSSPKHESESCVQTVSEVTVEKKRRRGRPPINDATEKMRRRKNSARNSGKYRNNKSTQNQRLDQLETQLIERQKQLNDSVQDLQIKHNSLLSLCDNVSHQFNKTNKLKFLRIMKKYSNK